MDSLEVKIDEREQAGILAGLGSLVHLGYSQDEGDTPPHIRELLYLNGDYVDASPEAIDELAGRVECDVEGEGDDMQLAITDEDRPVIMAGLQAYIDEGYADAAVCPRAIHNTATSRGGFDPISISEAEALMNRLRAAVATDPLAESDELSVG